jgi:hypothetical protein
MSGIGLLGGCAYPGSLVVGQSTAADARARMGAPTDTSKDRNGDELWDYATGPEGFETHRVRIGADGKVKEVTQVVTEDQLAKVIPGTMTRSDVRELLGRPAEEMTYGTGLTWSWRFKRIGLQPGFLVVSFNPDGTVKDKIVLIDPSPPP